MRGFATAPGFMVLDLDTPKGTDEGKPDGHGVLRALGVGIGDPAMVVRTGSGGYHLYYRIPDGVDIPQIAHKPSAMHGQSERLTTGFGMEDACHTISIGRLEHSTTETTNSSESPSFGEFLTENSVKPALL